MGEGTEAIREDINSIRDSMSETMEQLESRVKGTVDTTVEQVKRTFDVKQQIGAHPWAAIGIAVATGYLLGNVDSGSGGSESGQSERVSIRATDTPPHKPGFLDDVMDQFGDELTVLKSAAIAVAVNMVRDTIQQNVPQLASIYQRAQQEGRPAPKPAATAPGTVSFAEAVGSNLNGI